MSNFPTTLPTLTDPVATEFLGLAGNGKGIAQLITEIDAELTAIATKLGVNSSAVTATVDYKLTHIPSTSLVEFDKVRLVQQLDQTLINNTVLPISFGASSESYDVGGLHDTVTNNTRVTIVTAGKYHIIGTVRYAGGNTTNRYETSIRINGSNVIASNSVPATATSVYVNVSTDMALVAGDYIELLGFQATGGSITAQAEPDTFLSAHLLP